MFIITIIFYLWICIVFKPSLLFWVEPPECANGGKPLQNSVKVSPEIITIIIEKILNGDGKLVINSPPGTHSSYPAYCDQQTDTSFPPSFLLLLLLMMLMMLMIMTTSIIEKGSLLHGFVWGLFVIFPFPSRFCCLFFYFFGGEGERRRLGLFNTLFQWWPNWREEWLVLRTCS
jgi:hypothetical protein